MIPPVMSDDATMTPLPTPIAQADSEIQLSSALPASVQTETDTTVPPSATPEPLVSSARATTPVTLAANLMSAPTVDLSVEATVSASIGASSKSRAPIVKVSIASEDDELDGLVQVAVDVFSAPPTPLLLHAPTPGSSAQAPVPTTPMARRDTEADSPVCTPIHFSRPSSALLRPSTPKSILRPVTPSSIVRAAASRPMSGLNLAAASRLPTPTPPPLRPTTPLPPPLNCKHDEVGWRAVLLAAGPQLCLSDQELRPKDAHIISLLLLEPSFAHICALDVSRNRLREDGLRHVCDALKAKPNPPLLRTLVLASNELTKTSAGYLHEMLIGNTTLTHLNLDAVELGDVGCATMACDVISYCKCKRARFVWLYECECVCVHACVCVAAHLLLVC
jgi:hypothetical protein